jgi:hypothetical protein
VDFIEAGDLYLEALHVDVSRGMLDVHLVQQGHLLLLECLDRG